jgi:hypothetical protein
MGQSRLDDDGGYYQNAPSRLNPRMVAPKPMRNANFDDRNFGGREFYRENSEFEVLDESLGLGNQNNLLASLLIDNKPRTPLDRIDVSCFYPS